MAADEELTFFHVTTYDRLPDIAEDGLVPGRGRGIGSAAYDAHRKGHVFLADADDLDRWHSLAERWAEYATDKPCEEDIIPVVLRVAIDEDALEVDDVARREGAYGSWKYKGDIEPEYLEVFTGTEFVPVEDWGTFDPTDACEWVEEEDLEEGGFYQFNMEAVLLPDDDVRSNPVEVFEGWGDDVNAWMRHQSRVIDPAFRAYNGDLPVKERGAWQRKDKREQLEILVAEGYLSQKDVDKYLARPSPEAWRGNPQYDADEFVFWAMEEHAEALLEELYARGFKWVYFGVEPGKKYPKEIGEHEVVIDEQIEPFMLTKKLIRPTLAQKHGLEIEDFYLKRKARKQLLDDKYGDQATFMVKHQSQPWYAIVHPSTRPGVEYQGSKFDDDGPYGHVEGSRDSVLEQLVEDGFFKYNPSSNPSSPRYLSLSTINKYVPDMKRRGVSEVARSPRGFLTAYKKAGGQSSRLTEQWRAKRDAFIARHMAQVQANKEPLFKGGEPTRRHLALIAWAYSPAAGRL